MPKGKRGFQKGHKPFEIKNLKERNRKIGIANSKSLKGLKHSKEHIKNSAIAHTGLKRSEKTKEKMRKPHSGKVKLKGFENHNWKGGKEEMRKRYLNKKEEIAGRKKPEQCEICGAMGRICFDHDHKTEKFRGWICIRCNLILGLAKDNVEILQGIVSYLSKK